MGVDELVPRIESMNGKRVTALGFLPECRGYECRLFTSEDDAKQAAIYWAELRAAKSPPFEPSVEEPTMLGIGPGEDMTFDDQARPFIGDYVKITGIVTDQCRFQGRSGCTDRSTDLEPVSIEKWHHPQ